MPPSTGNRFQLRGRLTTGAAWLLGLVCTSFLLYLFANRQLKLSMIEWLALSPHALFHQGHVWTLLTTGFLYPGDAVFEFLMDAAMLFLFVPMLERWWGTKRFIGFFFATTLVGNLASVLLAIWLQADIWSLTPFLYGSIVAFGVLYSHQEVMLFAAFRVKARSLALGAAALMALMVLLDRRWVMGAGAFSAMALAWLMTSVEWTPNLWWLQFQRWRVKRKFGIVDGGKRGNDKQKWVN
jgi:membrane associated rhomboid family serine protease